jgi:hypothetical protein
MAVQSGHDALRDRLLHTTVVEVLFDSIAGTAAELTKMATFLQRPLPPKSSDTASGLTLATGPSQGTAGDHMGWLAVATDAVGRIALFIGDRAVLNYLYIQRPKAGSSELRLRSLQSKRHRRIHRQKVHSYK